MQIREKNQWWGVVRSNREWEKEIVTVRWSSVVNSRRHYEGEPRGIPILFDTRQQARNFCQDLNRKYKSLGYRFSPRQMAVDVYTID